MRATVSTRPVKLLVVFTMVLLVAGCGEREQIRTYTVPKQSESPPASAAPAQAAIANGEHRAPTDRMLAAVLPAGDRAWFFKVVGPIDAIEKQTDAISRFFASIKLPADGRPQWDVPEGWTEEQGTGMRAATLRIPTDGEPLELSVIALPWRGTAEDLLSNINRWRSQLQLPPVAEEQLEDFSREVAVGDATMTIVDLRGQFEAGPAMAPFAPGAGRPPGEDRTSEPNLPAGHPPIGGEASRAPVGPVEGAPSFEAPDSWEALPAGGMRKAAFQVGDQEEGALVTLIDFPVDAGPMITDPYQNVNRWRIEVGLPKVAKDQLDDVVEEIEIDGKPATYVVLVPDPEVLEQSKLDRATLGAMVVHEERIWFIKMTGTRNTVAEQQDAFRHFLDTIEFE